MLCNQQVGGSIPLFSTIFPINKLETYRTVTQENIEAYVGEMLGLFPPPDLDYYFILEFNNPSGNPRVNHDKEPQ